tara:strand:+ start:2856 stop:3332 length:477 start_codon:yes stop_codon:yes gene_type:complete
MNYKEVEGHTNYIIFKTGKIYSKRNKRFIKIWKRNEYLGASLDTKSYSLHRLLAVHFIDNPEDKPEVDHIDRNKFNNNLDNLRWCTRSENIINTGVSKNNKLNEKNIYKGSSRSSLYYVVEIIRNGKKYTRWLNDKKYTLEEAVAFREAMLEDINNLY